MWESTNPDGIDKKGFEETTQKIREVSESLSDLKDSGGSWFDIGKGAVGGIFGRTLLHGLRGLLVAYLPGGLGSVAIAGLGLFLGGSSGKDKKTAKPNKKN